MNKESIYGLTFEQLTAWLSDHGHKKFRASQVWEWLYRTRVTSFSEMTDVNKECIKLLEEHFVIQTLTEHVKQEAADGTIKFLFKLQDGNLIETVMMRHKYGISVCVTTQVGCNIGCSFCASGLLAKSRDLSSGEIVEQIMNVQLHLDKLEQGDVVSHVVVMGIGEPFDNFENMLDFLKVLMDHKGLAIAGRRITVSTSGLAHKIYEFTDTQLQVNLAISLHAPNNELRTQIMKINRGIPIEKLMKSLDYYLEKTNRRITIEYILLKDVNDHKEEAEQLADLLDDKKHRLYVNLIPYNPVDEHSQYQRSDKESVLSFYDTLKKRGINCKIRQEHGTDIDAACGQLRSKQIKKAEAK
ncbi:MULTISPECIES: 23S rRNA (adenine(2503)-C(2))-methyltransferase RlmN [Peribacillus]|jgi:23S rRNA (adenine2503-C2)-methyltransferase|uniref:Probable dual-specificity RNA methyltransferase RlmN n=1 Tax=Peribacillus castrilensis TaxID=2897690 RepID=A0AAW9N3N8_9BACI|nr:23S rRNA (adenine(2503)-C(2))-methyltransferase RlmN [Peribacillus frigoritolerans]MBL3643012.1 23S rRNA (adenine(2503)-C(2))-methyltransferase RlmN [Bacillus sp. RHFB]MEC0271511.1 23S rRNA (adenine(2503)-C(2))-methyltransferase RlmN [Peribacillus castrilensis]MCK2002371.1 23S rRNA (adenine(2503)-C(2))-methyltransferase RlmN [Peribacillus frigoritolerans]MCU6602028.1 23S rRNA (adenine(2503)-C(2))-methyltransferase RlmN [Peribacillus frigoritolerans]MEB2491833.1 23S rRNA (adenine(2503)-C(2))